MVVNPGGALLRTRSVTGPADAQFVALVDGAEVVGGGELERRRRGHAVDRDIEVAGANRAHQHARRRRPRRR